MTVAAKYDHTVWLLLVPLYVQFPYSCVGAKDRLEFMLFILSKSFKVLTGNSIEKLNV